MAVQKVPLEFGGFGYRKEREIEAPVKMCPVRAEVVEEKAVDLRRMTVAGPLAAQLGHPEPHEHIPDAADADVGMVVGMTGC